MVHTNHVYSYICCVFYLLWDNAAGGPPLYCFQQLTAPLLMNHKYLFLSLHARKNDKVDKDIMDLIQQSEVLVDRKPAPYEYIFKQPVIAEPPSPPTPDVCSEIRLGIRRPRLTVNKTNLHIYASIVDDKNNHVLAAASTKTPDVAKHIPYTRKPHTKTLIRRGNSVAAAWELGKVVARRALRKGIVKIRFDKAEYKYHGKIRAVAEAARKTGLIF